MKPTILRAVVVAVTATALTACATPTRSGPDPITGSAVAVTPSPYDAQVEVLTRLTDGFGFVRTYVQVARGLSDEQVVALARRLHADAPTEWFWMLDDDEQAAQFVDALPRALQGDTRGYPLEWVEQHTVAHVVLELVPGGDRRWVLYRGTGSDDLMAVLDGQ